MTLSIMQKKDIFSRFYLSLSLGSFTWVDAASYQVDALDLSEDSSLQDIILDKTIFSSEVLREKGLDLKNEQGEQIDHLAYINVNSSMDSLTAHDPIIILSNPLRQVLMNVSSESDSDKLNNNYEINSPITITNSTATLSVTLYGDQSLTISNGLKGSGNLLKKGQGSLILSQNSSEFEGNIFIDSGSVIINTDAQVNGTVHLLTADSSFIIKGTYNAPVIYNDGEVSIENENSLREDFFSIVGTGSVVKKGEGSVYLSNNQNYSGGTFIESGSLILNEKSLQGNIENQEHLEMNIDQLPIAFNGRIINTGIIVKSGQQTLELLGELDSSEKVIIQQGELIVHSSSFSGDYENYGILRIKNDNEKNFENNISGDGLLIVEGSSELILSGNINQTGPIVNYNNSFELNANNLQASSIESVGVTNLNLSQNKTYEGSLTGDGAWIKSGLGSLSITGLNTGTGDILISQGTLEFVDQNLIIQDITTESVFILNQANDDCEIYSLLKGEGVLIKKGTGQLSLLGKTTLSGGVQVEAGSILVNENSLQGDFINHGIIQIDLDIDDLSGDDSFTYNGVISGSGSLKKTGLKNLSLTKEQYYTGDTLIEEGVLTYENDHLLNDQSLVNISEGAVFNLNGHQDHIRTILGNGTIDLGTGGELTINDHSIASFGGVIKGDSALKKIGSGELILSGDNIYTGGTKIHGGSFIIDNGAHFQGDLELIAGTTVSINPGAFYELTDGHKILVGEQGSLFLKGTIKHDGNIKIGVPSVSNSGGQIEFDGVNFKNQSGSLAILEPESELNYPTITIKSGGVTFDVDSDSTTQLNFATNGNIFSKFHKKGQGHLNLTATGGHLGSFSVDQGAVIVDGVDGSLMNSSIQIQEGSFLKFQNYSSLNVVSDIFIDQEDGLIFDDSFIKNNSNSNNSYTIQSNHEISLSAIGVKIDTAFGDLRIEGGTKNFQTDHGSLKKISVGVLTLAGDLNHDGSTVIEEGIINFENNLTKGNLIISGKAVFDHSIDLNTSVSMSGTGEFIKKNSGFLTIESDLDFSGLTKIEDGKLIFKDSITNSSLIQNNSVLELFHDQNKNLSSDLNGGSIIKKGTGVSVLGGNQIYIDRLEINSGAVNIAHTFTAPIVIVDNDSELKFLENSSILIDKNVTLTNNGSFIYSGALLKTESSLTELSLTQTGNDLILDSHGLVIDTSEKNLTINASFTGNDGFLKKTGANVLILTQSSDYLGETQIEQGSIKLVNSSLQSTIHNSSIFEIMNDLNHDLEFSIHIDGTGVLLKSGAGVTILNGNQDYTGATQVNSGTLDIKNNFYSTTLSTASGSILKITDNDYHAVSNIVVTNSGLTVLDNVEIIYEKLDGSDLSIIGTGNAISLSLGEVVFDSKDKKIECNINFSNYQNNQGSLRKKSSGILVLKGTNNYTGLTTIEDGKITLDNTLLSGNVFNSSELEFIVNQNTSKNFQPSIAGDGDLIKTGGGSLLVLNQQTYIGSTNIKQGSVYIYDDFKSRSIETEENALLEFKDQSKLSPEYNLSITNRGRINFDGVTFNQNSNANYEIQISSDSLPIELTNKGAVFQINEGQLTVYSDIKNNDAKNGILRKKGDGTLVLTGALTYTGTTFADEGTLVLDNTVTQGILSIKNEVSFINSNNKTQSAVIAGSGRMIKAGEGSLTLTGINTHTGMIRIDEGILRLQGTSSATSYEILEGAQIELINNSQLSITDNTSFTNNGLITANGVTVKSSGGSKAININGNNKLKLLSNGLIIDTSQGDLIINGGLTDENSEGFFNKIGNGSVYLNQNSDYQGSTQVTSGNLIINGGFQSSSWVVSTNSLLKLSATSEIIVDQTTVANSGKILIDGALIKSGDLVSEGTFSLIQGNSLKVTANGLKIDTQNKDLIWNASIINEENQQGVFVKKGQNKLEVNSLIDLRGSFTVENGSLITSSIIVHPEIFINQGASLTFSENSTFKLSKLNQTIENEGNFVFDGGVIANESAVSERVLSSINPFELSSKGLIIDTSLGAIKITSDISDYQLEEGTITKKSSGTLTLTGSLSSTGDIDLQAGTLYLLDTTPRASINNSSVLVADISSDKELFYSKTISGTGTFLKKGSGTLTLNEENIFTGQTTLNNGILNINNLYVSSVTIESNGMLRIQNQGDFLGNIINNSSQQQGVIFDHTDNKVYTKNISGTGKFLKDGAGTLSYQGQYSSSGSSFISNGTLKIDNGANWNGSINLTTEQSNLELNSSAQLTLSNTESLKFSNGAQAIIKGKISISDAIYLGGEISIPDAKILINGGVIENSTSRLTTINSLSQNVKIEIAQSGLTINGTMNSSDIKINTPLTGAGTLTKTGSNKLILNASSNHFQTNIQSGSFELMRGNTLEHQLTIASSATAYLYGQYAPTSSEIMTVNGSAYFYTPLNSAQNLSGKIVGESTGVITFESGGQFNYQGDASGFLGIIDVKNSELITSSSSILAGSIKVDVGSTLELKGIYQGSSLFHIENQGVFKIENSSVFSSKSIDSSFQGAGDFIKKGPGQVYLNKDVDHSGNLYVEAGTLKIKDKMIFGKLNDFKTITLTDSESILNLDSGANLDIRGSFNQTGQGHLFFDRSLITVNPNVTTQLSVTTAGSSQIDQEVEAFIDQNKYLIWHGSFSDHLGSHSVLKKTGLGTLVLDGSQEYTGSTQVENGVLVVDTATHFQSNLINNATLKILTSNSSKTIPQDISGRGSLIKDGVGVLDLSGELTYQGNTTVQNGRLKISQGMSTGLSSVWSAASGASLFFDHSQVILNKDLTLEQGSVYFDGVTIVANIPADNLTAVSFHGNNIIGANQSRLSIEPDGLTVLTEDTSLNISLPISGVGGLVKMGSKKLSLSGPATNYQGNTVISNGTLEIMESFSSLSPIENNSTLMFSNREQSSFELTQNITGTGGVIAQQGETILSGDVVSYQGPSNVVPGARLVLKDSFTGQGDFELEGTLAVITNQPRILINDLKGNGTFQKYGSSTLTINEFMRNFTGITEIYEGHLEVNGSLSGVVRIYGSATYSGEITIDDSSESIIEGVFNGAVLNNNNLLYVGNSYLNQSINAKINGVGTLIKVGKNKLVLAGANHTYTGHFLIQNGLMSIDSNFNSVTNTTIESGAVLKITQGSNLSGLTKINNGSFLHIDSKINDKESDLAHVINEGFMIIGSSATNINQQSNAFQEQVQVKIGSLELSDNSKLVLRISKENQPDPRPVLEVSQWADQGGRILLKTQGFGADFKNQEYKLITGPDVEQLEQIASKIEVSAMFDASFSIKDSTLCVNISKKSSNDVIQELASLGEKVFIRQLQSDQLISKKDRLIELTQIIDSAPTKEDLSVIANQLTPDISQYKNLTNLYLQKNLYLMNSIETQLAVGQNFLNHQHKLSDKKLVKKFLSDISKTKFKIANHEKFTENKFDWISLNKVGLSIITEGYRVDSMIVQRDHEPGSFVTSYGFQALISHQTNTHHNFKMWAGLNHSDYKVLFNITGKDSTGHSNDKRIGAAYSYIFNNSLEFEGGISLGTHQMEYQRTWTTYQMDNDNLNIISSVLDASSNANAYDTLFSLKAVSKKDVLGTEVKPYIEFKWNNFYRQGYEEKTIDRETNLSSTEGNNVLENISYTQVVTTGAKTYTPMINKNIILDIFQEFSLSRISYADAIGYHRFQYQFDDTQQVFEVPYEQKTHYSGLYGIGIIYRLNEFMSFGSNYEIEKSYYYCNKKIVFSGELTF